MYYLLMLILEANIGCLFGYICIQIPKEYSVNDFSTLVVTYFMFYKFEAFHSNY